MRSIWPSEERWETFVLLVNSLNWRYSIKVTVPSVNASLLNINFMSFILPELVVTAKINFGSVTSLFDVNVLAYVEQEIIISHLSKLFY